MPQNRTVSPQMAGQINDLYRYGFSKGEISRMLDLDWSRVNYWINNPEGKKIERTLNFIPFHRKSKEYNCAASSYCRRRDPIQSKLTQIASRCKRLNIAFNLKRSDIPENSICPVYGTQLTFSPDEKDFYLKATIDRVNPKGGYTTDNIAILSLRANMLKSDATKQDLQKLVDYIDKHEKKDLRVESP